MNARRLAETAALALAVVGLSASPSYSASGGDVAPAPARTRCTQPAKVQVAPDFERPDLQGRRLRLRDYRGKIVLLSFWATWCAPCLEELPTLSRWQHERGEAGLQVVGISMDDDAGAAARAVRKFALPYPVAMGDEDLGTLYGGVLGLPLALLIDRDGRIVARCQGELDLVAVKARIESLLSTPRP